MADVDKEIGIRINIDTNPANAAEKVSKGIDNISASTEKARKTAKSTSGEMAAGFKAVQSQAAALPGPIGNVANAFGSLTQGVSAFTKGLFTIKGALIATGIGAFVVVVGTLTNYFLETEKGAQKLRTIMAGLGAVVRTVADAIMSLDFRNLTTRISENTQAAIANAKALNQVEEAEGDLTVKRAEANKEITRARLIADDMTRSTEERIEAVKRAGDIEKQVAAEELTIQRQRLAAMESNLNMKKDASEEERDLVDQAKVRLADLERETMMREKRLGSEVQSLKNEQASKDKERDAARLASIKERDAAELELAKQKEEELKLIAEGQFKVAEQRIKNEETIDEFIAERKARTAEEQMQLEIERAIAAEEAKYAAVVSAMTAQNATIEEMEEAWFLSEQERMNVENNIRYEYDQKRLALATQIEDAITKKNKEANDARLAKEQQVAAARMNMAQQTGNALIGIGKLVSASMAKNAEVAKGIATAEVWINAAVATASAISKAVQSSVTPYDMIANIAVAVGTVAGAIASTISILDQAQIPGGGGASAGSMPSFTSSAPQATPVSTNVTNLTNTQSAELQPIQAFVVETQMTGTQGNIAQIYSQATFGLGE